MHIFCKWCIMNVVTAVQLKRHAHWYKSVYWYIKLFKTLSVHDLVLPGFNINFQHINVYGLPLGFPAIYCLFLSSKVADRVNISLGSYSLCGNRESSEVIGRTKTMLKITTPPAETMASQRMKRHNPVFALLHAILKKQRNQGKNLIFQFFLPRISLTANKFQIKRLNWENQSFSKKTSETLREQHSNSS